MLLNGKIKFGNAAPKKSVMLTMGAILFVLFIFSALAKYHLKTEHKLKLESLENVRLELVYAHLEREDSTLTTFRLNHIFTHKAEGRLNKLLEVKWDDYIIPLLSKTDREKVEIILSQVKRFNLLLKQRATPNVKLAHDVVFNDIINNINDLHLRLNNRVKRQNNFIYVIQIILIITLIVWLIVTVITLINIRKDRKKILSKQEELLIKLKHNNFFLEKAQDISKIGYYTYNLKTDNWTASDFILDLMAYKPDVGILRQWKKIVHPEDRNVFKKVFYKNIRSNLSLDLSYRIIKPPNDEVRWVHQVASKLEDTDNQDDISVIGVIQDITEQKTIAMALEQSHQKFKSLFDENPIALWEEDYSKVIQLLNDKKQEFGDLKTYLDEHPDFVLECVSRGKILNTNRAVLDLFEVADKEALVNHLNGSFNNELLSIYKNGLLDISSNEETFSSEVDFVTKNGKVISTIIKVVKLDDNGKIVFSINDITEIKTAEKSIIESQEKLNEAIDITRLGTFSFRSEIGAFKTSSLFDEIIGITGNYIKNIEEFVKLSPPDDCQYLDKLFYDTSITIIEREFRVKRPRDNKIIWILLHAKKVYDKNSILLSITGTIQDITQRKIAEEKVKFSDAILQKVDSIILVNDYNANVIFASPSVKSILGYEPKEVLGQAWWQLTFSDKEAVKKSKNRISNYRFEKGPFKSSIRQVKTKDGVFKWIEWHNSKGLNNTCISVGIDITTRKEAEEKLKQSDAILKGLNTIVLVNDENVDIIYASPSVRAILGYEWEELLGQGWWDLTYESAEEAKKVQKAVANYLYHDGPKNKRVSYRKIKTKNGTYKHIEWYASKGVDKTYINIGVDITQRHREEQIKNIIFNITKEAQKQPQLASLLHFVKESLSAVIDTSNFYVALYNSEKQNFSLPYVTGEDADMQGKTFPIGKSLTGYVLHKAQTTVITESDFEVLRKKGEVKLVGKSSKIWVGIPLFENSKGIGVIVVQSFTDEKAFTQKDIYLLELIAINISVVIKQAQDLEKINLLNTALTQSPASIVITDKAGCIEYVNPTFTKLSGYTYKEAIGENPRILKSGDQDDAYYKNLWDTITTGKTWKGEFVNKRKEGNKYLVSASISAVKDASGEITHFIGIQEDITEKRKLERDYINAFIDAQEQEKQSFGEDLHDGISQILSAEGMYIDILLQNENLDSKKVKKFLEKIKEHNLNAINDARRIAHGLMSKQLKQKGLLKALEHICDDYNHSRNIRFNIFNDKLKEKEINKTIKTNIYRVCQEITTNILRHSGATKASISFSKTVKNELKLIIEDNGVGIDFEKMKRENRGAGLKNIERRITLLSGKLDLESTLNKGTKFTIIVPLDTSI